VEGVDAGIVFRLDSTGRVRGLVLHQNGETLFAGKTG